MVREYVLDDAVVNRLSFYFKTFIGKQGNTKNVDIDDNKGMCDGTIRIDKDDNLPSRTLKL